VDIFKRIQKKSERFFLQTFAKGKEFLWPTDFFQTSGADFSSLKFDYTGAGRRGTKILE
jgi:hypothetical protein